MGVMIKSTRLSLLKNYILEKHYNPPSPEKKYFLTKDVGNPKNELSENIAKSLLNAEFEYLIDKERLDEAYGLYLYLSDEIKLDKNKLKQCQFALNELDKRRLFED